MRRNGVTYLLLCIVSESSTQTSAMKKLHQASAQKRTHNKRAFMNDIVHKCPFFPNINAEI